MGHYGTCANTSMTEKVQHQYTIVGLTFQTKGGFTMAKKYNYTKNGKQYFRIVRTINGKRKEFYGDGEKDALRQYQEYLRKIDMGLDPDAASRKFNDAFTNWLYDIKKLQVRESTMFSYDTAYKVHIKNAEFANKRLMDIKRIDIEKFVSDLHDQGLSESTINQNLSLIKSFFSYMVVSDILPKNPATRIMAPSDESDISDKIVVFTPEEQKKIIEESRKVMNGFLFELALCSGLRLGELIALEYADFTPEGVWVKKTQSISRKNDKDGTTHIEYSITIPKSKQGVRFVPLPQSVLSQLELHKKAQVKMLNGQICSQVFLSVHGKKINNPTVQRRHKLFLSSIGIPHKKFHTYRHTYITNCIQAGIDIMTVRELAGHGNISMTQRYTHISTDHKIEAVKTLFESMI